MERLLGRDSVDVRFCSRPELYRSVPLCVPRPCPSSARVLQWFRFQFFNRGLFVATSSHVASPHFLRFRALQASPQGVQAAPVPAEMRSSFFAVTVNNQTGRRGPRGFELRIRQLRHDRPGGDLDHRGRAGISGTMASTSSRGGSVCEPPGRSRRPFASASPAAPSSPSPAPATF